MALKEEIVNHPSRKFLKPWREQQGDEAFFGFLRVFCKHHGKAHVVYFGNGPIQKHRKAQGAEFITI